MNKYVKAEMEIIEFEAEDVITTSSCTVDVGDWGCGNDGQPCWDYDLG